MKVNQIYEIMNGVTSELTGKSDLVKEDLSNIVDVGAEILDTLNVDNYVKSLVDRIGKVIFVNRAYAGNAPKVLMDSWEFGSVLEKIACEIPEATENDSWNLENNKDYSPNVFYKPTVTAKFFNKKITFEVDLSFTTNQVKESFTDVNQLNGFLSMLFNSVEKSMTVKIDSLIMRTINNMIAETVIAEYDSSKSGLPTDYNGKNGIKACNLLTEYNNVAGTSLTKDKALTNKDFIRFAVMKMSLYTNRMSKLSTLFNVGGAERFTDRDNLGIVLLADFKTAASTYLASDTYHNEFVALPNADTVPYWQGSGKTYSFDSISSIHVNTSSNKEVAFGGIIGIMYDREAIGVSNLSRRVTTNYNPKGEFYTNFYKFDAGYYNDLNENFVVFYIA